MKRDKFIPDFPDIPSNRTRMQELELEERLDNFEEVDLGFTQEEATKEALRCLSCRRCLGCGLCLADCDYEAIDFEMQGKTIEINADAVLLAPGLESFNPSKISFLGYRENPNVITSLELERILSPTGPYQGIFMRPYDGRIPQRIGFIQCVGAREEGLGRDYCGNICCSTTLKQVNEILGIVKDAKITIFYRDIRPFGIQGEAQLLALKQNPSISFLPAQVNRISQDEEGSIIADYVMDDIENKQSFDIIVLATAQGTENSKRLSRSTGIKTNKYGFVEEASPLKTSQPQVYAAGSFISPMGIEEAKIEGHAVAAKILQEIGFEEAGNNDSIRKNDKARTGIVICKYGLSNIYNKDAIEVRNELVKLYPKHEIEIADFACLKQGYKTISKMKDELDSVIVFPCYENNRKMIGSIAESFDLKGGLIACDEMGFDDAIQEIKEGIAKVSAFRQIEDILVLGTSLAALSASETLLSLGKKVIWAFAGDIEDWRDVSKKARYDALLGIPGLTTLPNAKLQGTMGEGFNRTITLSQNDFDIDLIVLAPSTTDYRVDEGFATNESLYRIIKTTDLKGIKSIIFLQCKGSRNNEFPFCSRFCCKESLENALKLKSSNPEIDISILHNDIRLEGWDEELYSNAIELGIRFRRIDGYVGLDTSGITLKDGERIDADLVVLANGRRPSKALQEWLGVLGLEADAGGFVKCTPRLNDALKRRDDIVLLASSTGFFSQREEDVQGLMLAINIDKIV